MASGSDSVECDDDEVSPRNLVVKLVKLEDQLGLTRWTTWSEVKMEPVDDYDDSGSNLMEDGGMDWVPVKEEPPDPMEEAGAFTPTTCPNGTGADGSEERHDSVDASGDGVDGRTGVVDRSSSSPATCLSLSALAPMDDAVSSRGDYSGASTVTASPETHAENNSTAATTSSSSHAPARGSPLQSISAVINHVPEPSRSAATASPVILSSPHVPTLDALNIQSPQVIFVGTLNKSGEHSGIVVPVSEDPVDMMDIASSQLTAVDDQTVRGLGDLVAASTSHTTAKLVTKRADRHRKGSRGKKTEKVSGKKKAPPTITKKTHRKKKGKQSSSKSGCKNHAVVAKLADGVIDKNHVNIVDSADVVVSKPKKKTKPEVSDTKDKGMFPMHPTLGKRIQSGNSTAFNLFRLALLLPNEEAAVELAQHFDLLPRFRFCPLCGQRLEKLYRIVRSGKRPLFRFQCNKQPCKLGRNQVPLRWGTKFVSSNLSLRKAIILDYCFVKKYDIPTAKSESAMPECEDSDRMVSTSTETVVDYYNHCREICAFFLMSLPLIGGLGYTVELFESFFVGSKSHNEGGSKSHKVHAFQGQYILAGICIENNDVLFAVAQDLQPSTILPLLQTKIALGTHVRTSSCEAYMQLKKFGYEHTVVKDTQLFVHNDLNFSGCSNVTQAGTMRPLTFHRRSGTFNLHLAEYLWRRKHRDANDLFVAYLEAVASVYPVSGPEGEMQAEGE